VRLASGKVVSLPFLHKLYKGSAGPDGAVSVVTRTPRSSSTIGREETFSFRTDEHSRTETEEIAYGLRPIEEARSRIVSREQPNSSDAALLTVI
jgi:hypothetical protein